MWLAQLIARAQAAALTHPGMLISGSVLIDAAAYACANTTLMLHPAAQKSNLDQGSYDPLCPSTLNRHA